ncbi:MAG: electron transfer flavoprotein subunit beta/FixA family protein [Halanaerobiales bacterium]
MNIVVCIKQVPDTSEVSIDPDTNTLNRQGVECIINPYDMNALETGLQLKEKFDGQLTVISMGPPQVKESLKETISRGADDVYLLSDRAFAGADTLATSYTLARGIQNCGDIDIIICGKQAIDGDTGQVGPGIAEQLEIPHVTYVSEIQEVTREEIRVKREMENGWATIEMKLPGLITVMKDINRPRLPSLRGIFRAQDMEVPVWTVDDLDVDEDKLGLDGSPTQVVSVSTPQIEEEGEIFTGEPEEQVDNLVQALADQQIL